MSHHYIAFNNVSFTYPGGKQALDGISFRVNHGEHVAILGMNGSGKSTLLLQTNGLLFPNSGEVIIGDIPVTVKTAKEIRRRVGIVFQNTDDMLFMPSVEDDVAFGPRNMDLPEEEIERRVNISLSSVGLLSKRSVPSQNLSGGEKRGVAIACVLSMEPDIMVMDEPSANLDMRSRRYLIKIISDFKHTALLATHDLEMARELCPRSILLDAGKVSFDGPTDECIQIMRTLYDT